MKLVAFNTSDGGVEIHKAGCADIKKVNKNRQRGGWRQEQVEFGKYDWPTRYAFCYDYWNNGILEEHEAEYGEGSFDVWQGMNFQPCCKALADGGPEPEPESAPKTKFQIRKQAREALWAGIESMLNDSVYQSQPELHAMMVAQSERVAMMFGMRD